MNIGYEGIETEAVAEKDEGGLVVQTGGMDVGEKKYIRKPVTKKQLESYTQETKEDEELVMRKSRVNLRHKPKRLATASRKMKKKAKRKTVRQSKMLRRNYAWCGECSRPGCPFRDSDMIQKRRTPSSRCTADGTYTASAGGATSAGSSTMRMRRSSSASKRN